MDSNLRNVLFVFVLQVLGCFIQHSNAQDPLVVRSLLLEPFLKLREDGESLTGKNRFDGYFRDFLDLVLDRRDQDYIIKADGENVTTIGEKDKENGTWTGMLGELEREEADIVAAPILLTPEIRRTGFMTRAIMDVSLKAVMRPPSHHTESRIFIFLRPFEAWSWVIVFAAFAVVGIVLWLIQRNDPYDEEYWGAKITRNTRKGKGLWDGLWVSFSGLMWQGYENGPRSTGGRILLGSWFIFVLAAGGMYIANLVHVLEQRAVETKAAPADVFNDDVINSGKYVYTVVEGDIGHVELFKESHISRFQTLADQLETVPSAEEGLRRASEEDNVIFISDSPILDYYMQREPCGDLAYVGGLSLAPNMYYGIAVSKDNSQLLTQVNNRINDISTNGQLNSLYNRWWKDGVQCEVESETSDTGSVAFQAVIPLELVGPIIVLLIGLLIAIIITVVEKVTYYRCTKWEPEKPEDVKLRHQEPIA